MFHIFVYIVFFQSFICTKHLSAVHVHDFVSFGSSFASIYI